MIRFGGFGRGHGHRRRFGTGGEQEKGQVEGEREGRGRRHEPFHALRTYKVEKREGNKWPVSLGKKMKTDAEESSPSGNEETWRRRNLSDEREIILDGGEDPGPDSSETFSVTFLSPVDEVGLAVVRENWRKQRNGREVGTRQFEI